MIIWVQLRLMPPHFTQFHRLSLHQGTTSLYSLNLNHSWTFHCSQSARTLFLSPLTQTLFMGSRRKNVYNVHAAVARSLGPGCQLSDWKEILKVQVQMAFSRTSLARFLNTLSTFQPHQINELFIFNLTAMPGDHFAPVLQVSSIHLVCSQC